MRILIAAATALLLSPHGVAAQDTRVLFLGNSYTARNNLPSLVQGLSAASGRTMLVDSNTPGGNTLGAPQGSGASHSTNQVSEQKIAAQPWDVVVLQDQSYIPTIPFGKTNWMFTGAQAIQLKVDTTAPSARVVLYQTWGRKAGGQFSWAGRSSPSFGSYGAMQNALSNAYGECGSLIGAEVAAVGEAWRRSQNLRPALELYSADQSHPALAGSYLAACVFHAQIYAESPVGLAYTAGLDPSVAAFLQSVAADVVLPGSAPVRPHVRLDPASMSGADFADGASIAHANGVFHAAWADAGGGDRDRQDILYARSTDDGRTWSAPARVDAGDSVHGADSDEPHLVVTENGTVVIVFRELRDAAAAGSTTADLFVNRSADGGLSWPTAARALNTTSAGTSVISDIHGHSVTTSGNTVTVVWEENLVAGPGGGDELSTTRSFDAGATWSVPTILTPFVFPAPNANRPTLSASSDANVFLAYDTNIDDPSGDIRSFRTTNGGITWTAGGVESNEAGIANRAKVVRDGDLVAACWLDDGGAGQGAFSVHAAVSQDGGLTFGPERDLTPGVSSTPGASAYDFDLVFSAGAIAVVSVDDSGAVQSGGAGGESVARASLARTVDAGATWTVEIPIDAAMPGRSHAAPNMAASGACMSLSLRVASGSIDAIGHTCSSDLGATWGTVAVASAGLGDVDTEPSERTTSTFSVSPSTGTSVALWWAPDATGGGNELRASAVNSAAFVGRVTCGSGVANSRGLPARIDAIGSDVAAQGLLALVASRLPLSSFGFFLGSRGESLVLGPGGSQGTLCLGGAIGRFVGPGQIRSTGSTGGFRLPVNIAQLPTPNGLVPASAGESWFFQAWYRDAIGGTATSNFTPAIAVTFR